MLILSFFIFRAVFVRRRGPTLWNEPPEATERHARLTEAVSALPAQRLHIYSRDKLLLTARYFPAEKPCTAAVICVHGYRGDGLHDHAHNVLRYHEMGYSVLLPDHRAHGESEGKYICFGAKEADDLRLWCRHLTDTMGLKKLLLHGVSMGAAAAVIAAGEDIGGLCGTVSDCAYTSGRDMFAYIAKRVLHLPLFPLLNMTLLASRIFCGADLKRRSPIEAVKKASAPFLFIHGTEDRFVPTKMARRLYDECKSDKRLLLFEHAHHAESAYLAPERYYGEIAAFMKKVGM